jgi:NADPH:quinone reductase-like Zn-dependent oxidoreductase
MAATMQAVVRRRWGAPARVIEVADLPQVEPADDEVRVRVLAASINRLEYYSLGTAAPLMRPMIGGFLRPKEIRLGSDFAGIADAVGKDVADVLPGDEVYGCRNGALGEYVNAKTAVARKPANLSFEEAAAVGVAGLTALQGIRDHAGLRPGERVLVNGGSGGVGSFAVQIAKALGAGHVTAVVSTRNVERARALGADDVVDYTRDDYTRLRERYDLIVDVAGNRAWRDTRRALAADGRVLLAGLPMGNRLTGPFGPLLRMKLASRFGPGPLVFFITKPNRPDLATLRDLIERGAVRPVVDRVYPLGEAADAIAAMGEGHVQGKLVVRVS